MKRQGTSIIVIALFSIVFAGLACGSKNSSPTKAVETFFAASKNKDVAAMKSIMQKEFLVLGEQRAKAQNKTLDEVLKQLLENGADRVPKSMETRNETIASDGKTATVEVKGDGPEWETMRLVKEDDGWKLETKQFTGG